MHTLNRILIMLFALLLVMVPGMALLAIPYQALGAGQDALAYLSQFSTVPLMGLGALLTAAGIFLLLMEAGPQRSTQFVARVGDGVVRYPHNAIADAIDRELITLEGVRDSKTRVSGRGQDVEADIKLVIAGAAATPEVINRAVAQARSKVEDSFGLKLRHPRLAIDRIEEASLQDRDMDRIRERERDREPDLTTTTTVNH